MAWVVPLLTKSADRVTDAFEKVLASAPKCAMLQTDRGKEFLNEKFQSMLRRHNIRVSGVKRRRIQQVDFQDVTRRTVVAYRINVEIFDLFRRQKAEFTDG